MRKSVQIRTWDTHRTDQRTKCEIYKRKIGACAPGNKQIIFEMASYEPLHGFGWKPLPKFIENKKAVINIKKHR